MPELKTHFHGRYKKLIQTIKKKPTFSDILRELLKVRMTGKILILDYKYYIS